MGFAMELDASEIKTRKNWLLVTFYWAFLSFFSGMFFFYSEIPQFGSNLPFAILGGVIGLVLLLLWNAALYFWTYKNHGNKFLIFNLATLPMGIISQIYNYESMPRNEFLHFLVMFALSISWFDLSFKLIKINKKIKQSILKAHPDVAEALNLFKDVKTIQELDLSFGKLLREKNDGNLATEESIVEAYKIQKATLKNAVN